MKPQRIFSVVLASILFTSIGLVNWQATRHTSAREGL